MRLRRSSFSRTWPALSMRTSRVSKALGVRGTLAPAFSRTCSTGSRRKGRQSQNHFCFCCMKLSKLFPKYFWASARHEKQASARFWRRRPRSRDAADYMRKGEYQVGEGGPCAGAAARARGGMIPVFEEEFMAAQNPLLQGTASGQVH